MKKTTIGGVSHKPKGYTSMLYGGGRFIVGLDFDVHENVPQKIYIFKNMINLVVSNEVKGKCPFSFLTI